MEWGPVTGAGPGVAIRHSAGKLQEQLNLSQLPPRSEKVLFILNN